MDVNNCSDPYVNFCADPPNLLVDPGQSHPRSKTMLKTLNPNWGMKPKYVPPLR